MYGLDDYLAREHRRDLMREAEQAREANMMTRQQQRDRHPLARVGRSLTKVGGQLIALAGEKA